MHNKLSKKSLIAIVASALVAVVLTVVLCVCLISRPVFKDGPKADDAVVGNGTMAVMKGDYLYFANGFVAGEENYFGNKGNKIYKSAIYRVKANGASNAVVNEKLEFNYGTLEQNKETASLVGAERLVSKIAGFENTKLYIFDNYLYFTSPSTSKDLQSGETKTAYIDICRVKLNGKGFERLYTIKNFSNGQVEFYKNGNDVYGVFYDGTDKLVVLKNKKKILEKTGVTAVAMPSFSTYYNGLDTRDEQTIVYLTSNSINQIKLPNKHHADIGEKSKTLERYNQTLISIENNVLYYSNSEGVFYLDLNLENTTIEDVDLTNISRNLTTLSLTSSLPVKADGGNYWLAGVYSAQGQTKCTIFTENGALNTVNVESGAILLFADEINLYYKTSDKLYSVNYTENNSESKLLTNSKIKFTNIPATFDGTYIHYFAEKTNKEGTSIYLERVCVRTSDEYVSEEISSRLVVDYPDPEETEETQE